MHAISCCATPWNCTKWFSSETQFFSAFVLWMIAANKWIPPYPRRVLSVTYFWDQVAKSKPSRSLIPRGFYNWVAWILGWSPTVVHTFQNVWNTFCMVKCGGRFTHKFQQNEWEVGLTRGGGGAHRKGNAIQHNRAARPRGKLQQQQQQVPN